MAATDFAHLHVHGNASLLDGLTPAVGAIEAVVADGQPMISLTDHGSLGEIFTWARAAEAAGVKFAPGIELYLSIGDRHEQNHMLVPSDDDFDGADTTAGKEKKKLYEHLTLLAATPAGWRNLQLVDLESRSTFYAKPRADYALLAQHAEGIIVGTGCLGGPVAGPLLRGDMRAAREALHRLVDIYGRDNVFVEVMDHGIAAERKVIPALAALAAEAGLPVVATNDVHYLSPGDHGAHDAWLCIGRSMPNRTVLVSDDKRFRFNGSGYHLRTAAEMHALFDDQPGTQDAVRNTLLIVERVEDRVVTSGIADYHRMPPYQVPAGHTLATYFKERMRQGMIERYGAPFSPELKARARFELDTILAFDLPAYLLSVADQLKAERDAGYLTGYGRGSGVGSVAGYALGITHVEPLSNGLLFERFLNPAKKSLPDYDSDVQASRQEAVFERIVRTYGTDRVARIGTYGTSWAKASLKSIGRVTGRGELATRLAKLIPAAGTAEEMSLRRLLEPDNPFGAELRAAVAESPDAADLVSQARAIEGSFANESKHACGVVIADEPLPGLVPLRRLTPKDPDSMLVTQWEAPHVEANELIKYDYLALIDLDVVATCIGLIAQSTGEQIDFYALHASEASPRADKARALFAQGRTAGVFQVSGDGITQLVQSVQPENEDDLSAILALYRPGPMGGNMHTMFAARRRGGEEVDYALYSPVTAEQEAISSVLGETFGLVVYQEQMMQLAGVVAGFDPAQKVDLQKAISKKNKAEIARLRPLFMDGGTSSTTTAGEPKIAFRTETLQRLWMTFEAAGSYAFNRSHSAAYARLTWTMAYLKANWPGHFTAAKLIHSESDNTRAAVMRDARSDGVVIRPPDVNDGGTSTLVAANGEVVLGMSETKGVGEAANAIVAQRDSGGPYTSVHDLVSRSGINSATLTALAEAGALDNLASRAGVVFAARGVAHAPVEPPAMTWGQVETASRQRGRLGIIVGEHPVRALKAQIGTWRETNLRGERLCQVHTLPRRSYESVNVAGVVASVEERMGRNGTWCKLVLESDRDSVEVLMWPAQYGPYRNLHGAPKVGTILAVTGTTRLYIPPVDPETGTGADPVVSVHASTLWAGPLHDPASPLPPAAGAVLTLVEEPAPEQPEEPQNKTENQADTPPPPPRRPRAIQRETVISWGHGCTPGRRYRLSGVLQTAAQAVHAAFPDTAGATIGFLEGTADGEVLYETADADGRTFTVQYGPHNLTAAQALSRRAQLQVVA